MYKRLLILTFLAAGAVAWPAPADNPKPGKATTDYDLVKNLNLCRSRYQANLEQLRAARLYDRYAIDRNKARTLYQEVKTHDTDPRRIQEADRRLSELGNQR